MSGVASVVLLQAEAAPGQDYSFFVMMGLIFLIFYVLVMRPQQKQQREKEESIKGAVKGDRVITAGGLNGLVTGVTDESVTIEIARVKGSKVEVEVQRARLDSVIKPGGDKTSAKEGSEKS